MRRNLVMRSVDEGDPPASGRGEERPPTRGALVGLFTLDNVGEFLLIQSALGRSPQPPVA